VADHVLPLTHAGTATQASAVAFHAKAGELQVQLDWPASALLVLYSCDVGHVRQAVSPSTENWPAPQGAQMVLLVAVHAPPLATAEPAAHTVQLAHGELPEALHVEPATHDCTARHESVGTSQ
jgi:hypothetical protein